MVNGFAGLIVGCLIIYGVCQLGAYLFRNYKAKGWPEYAQSDKEFNEQERKDREKERDRGRF